MTTRSPRRGSCRCGRLHLDASGEPARVSICHCRDCQRRTGSVFGVQARFPVDRVTISGDDATWSRTGDEGGSITFHFCPTCGATVWYACEDEPELIGVPVGAFADPDFPRPDYSIYGERRHHWVQLPSGIPAHD